MVGGVEQTVWTPMQDVARYVASRVNAMLVAARHRAGDAAGVGAAPLDERRAVGSSSAPLRALETPHALRFGQSLCGAAAANARRGGGGDRPTTPAASRPSARFLQRRGVPAPGLRLLDGSGLSPQQPHRRDHARARFSPSYTEPALYCCCRSAAARARSKTTISRRRLGAFARRAGISATLPPCRATSNDRPSRTRLSSPSSSTARPATRTRRSFAPSTGSPIL